MLLLLLSLFTWYEVTCVQTLQHPMWVAWDLALELCLDQMPTVLSTEDPYSHVHSPFFEEQLTAFQVWLDLGHECRESPEQLPIVLQVKSIFCIGNNKISSYFQLENERVFSGWE